MSQRICCEGNDHGSAQNTCGTFEYSCHFADVRDLTASPLLEENHISLQHKFENFYGEQFRSRDVFSLISRQAHLFQRNTGETPGSFLKLATYLMPMLFLTLDGLPRRRQLRQKINIYQSDFTCDGQCGSGNISTWIHLHSVLTLIQPLLFVLYTEHCQNFGDTSRTKSDGQTFWNWAF